MHGLMKGMASSSMGLLPASSTSFRDSSYEKALGPNMSAHERMAIGLVTHQGVGIKTVTAKASWP